MNTQIITVTNRQTKKKAKIKIDKKSKIDFKSDYVHAPDTSLFVGFDYGKISKRLANKASKEAGFEFYKIIEADKTLNIPVDEIKT